MKKLIIILFALVLSFITTQAIAQHEKNSKWDLAFSYGLAEPIGSFGKVVPEETVITYNETGWYVMFDKEGHGAAKNGQFFSSDLSYHFNKHWLMSLVANHSQDKVDTKPVLDFLNSITDPDLSSFTNNDYKVNILAVGLGYQFYVKKINFRLTPILGYAVISSPDYSFLWGNLYSYDVTDKENSVLFGFNSGINYQINSKFYLGLKIHYHSADFNYSNVLKSPGSTPYNNTDLINYRLLQTGFTFGVRF